MATAAPEVPVDLGSVISNADAQLSALVAQATAEPTPQPTPEAAPVAEPPSTTETPVAAPLETAPATDGPTPSEVITFDLKTLTPEQRKDYDDAVAKEGDPLKVFSRYWEQNNRLARIARGTESAPEPKVAPTPEPEVTAAPPQEAIVSEVRDRLSADPEVGMWRAEYSTNKQTLGELLKVDPALPKPDFDAVVSGAYGSLAFEIKRIQANLGEQYVKDNPDIEQGLRQKLADLKSDRMEIDRLRMSNERLDERFASKAQTIQSRVSEARRQEYETQQAATRQETEIRANATRFDSVWPVHLATIAKNNDIADEIKGSFELKARYEVLGMIHRGELDHESQLPSALDKIAKAYKGEIDLHHRYMSRVHALKQQQTAEQPIIVPPNSVATQDTNRVPMSRQEVDSAADALLRRTLGEAALR